jgi:hypothetical protein
MQNTISEIEKARGMHIASANMDASPVSLSQYSCAAGFDIRSRVPMTAPMAATALNLFLGLYGRATSPQYAPMKNMYPRPNDI